MKRNPFLYFVIVVGIPYKIWVFLKKKFILIFSGKRKRKYLKLLARKNKQIIHLYPNDEDLSQLNMCFSLSASGILQKAQEKLSKLKKQRERIINKCKRLGISQRKIDLFNN